MFSWQVQRNKGWLTFGLVVFLCLPQLVWAGSRSLQRLEQRYQQKNTYVRKLYKRRQRHMLSVRKAARSLALLKKQASRKGLLGIPARMRLPRARAAAERLVKKVRRLDRRLNKHNKRLKRIRQQLRKLYRKKLKGLKKQILRAKKTKRAALLKTLQSYRVREKRLSQSAPGLARRALPRLRVRIDPLDGPSELRQKADVLKDQEDRIKKRMLKLKLRITAIRKRYATQRKDQKLARHVRRMTSEDDLFNEGERNPRVTTGARTSRRMRSRNNQSTNQSANTKTSSTKAKDYANNAPTQEKAPNTDSASPPAAMGGSAPSRSGGTPQSPKSGTTNNSQGDKASKNQPLNQGNNNPLRIGYRIGGRFKYGDPLKPNGTLPQQLRALQRYQKALKQRAQQLQKKQRQFLNRAKKLQKKEKRRRR